MWSSYVLSDRQRKREEKAVKETAENHSPWETSHGGGNKVPWKEK